MKPARLFTPVLLAAMVLAGCAPSDPGARPRHTPVVPERAPSPAPVRAPQPVATHKSVVYEVTGSADRGMVTYATGTGMRQSTVRVPWESTTVRMDSWDVAVMNVQNQADRGTIGCRITVDGRQVSSNSSSGAYAIASCDYMIP